MDPERGVIQFDCRWRRAGPFPGDQIGELNRWRSHLRELELIGVYENRIGYGNISQCLNDTNQFLITASQTGYFEVVTGEHYAKVLDFSVEENWLQCEGPKRASSESLTHGVIYQVLPEVRAVIHVHHEGMWNYFLDKSPTTEKSAEAGTPEIAQAVGALALGMGTQQGFIVMGGHPEGLMSYGRTMDEAGELLLGHMKEWQGSV